MNLITDYREHKPRYLLRITWFIVNATLFRCLPTKWLQAPRRALLRLFGAKIHPQAHVYASVKIFAPWNLSLDRCLIGPKVIIYNKAPIRIGRDTIVSQRTTLCTASHDISSAMMDLVARPITLGDNVWVASEAFVGPGVELGEGTVVGARAAVFKSVEPWTVVGGNPAMFLKSRKIEDPILLNATERHLD